ncbi:hypothetical protein MBM_05112 [Drepanopeziza brunnea f. sp. 'multigermtubi' MB_m1]|uniref:Uncharacterized protein n=1 Tax=Marssonina brunnea f. sp. multigermtubi (strain MB_m1) TaxID=1072389 RepID=K1X7R3_MARBU|nr:uncharacterized protein MBM_05112 [Drepanopeziza brunnea f. sp. 'multigermtubi' MB_m1]EKD16643.1 hypothetical protein MBM_05112 [Drepanopeziza brunnea f. sp. 'multigermtubi' MB_m1]
MPEVKSASEVEFRLLLSATDHKDEEEEEVKDTGTRCKTIAFARTPRTQLKLLINTGIKVASVKINAAARDKAKKPLPPSEGSKLTRIKKNVRQQREKNYGTFRARASQESGTAVEIDSEDGLFDSVIGEEFFGLARADEAIEDVEGKVEIT